MATRSATAAALIDCAREAIHAHPMAVLDDELRDLTARAEMAADG